MSLVLTMSMVYSKTNTSFKVGLPYSTAQLLLGNQNVQGKNFTPTIGLSYFGLSMSSKYTENGETDKWDVAARFLIPRLGVRLLGNRSGDLNSYYFGEVFMVLPFISGSDISSDTKKEIKDATDLIGITLGYGVEYFFSESFSLGGELAFNMVLHSMTNENSDEWDNYKSEYNTRLEATFTQITFNYYFQ